MHRFLQPVLSPSPEIRAGTGAGINESATISGSSTEPLAVGGRKVPPGDDGTLVAQVDDHNQSICTDMCGGAREYYSLSGVLAKADA